MALDLAHIRFDLKVDVSSCSAAVLERRPPTAVIGDKSKLMSGYPSTGHANNRGIENQSFRTTLTGP